MSKPNKLLIDDSLKVYQTVSFWIDNKNILRYFNGSDWQNLKVLTQNDWFICGDNYKGSQYFGGKYLRNGTNNLLKHNNGSWTEIPTYKKNSEELFLKLDNNGNIYTGGIYTSSGTKYFIAKYNGTTWQELGTVGYFNGIIKDILIVSDNEIYAVGEFKNGSGNPFVAKWNGTNWSELGSFQFNNTINTIAKFGQNILVGGRFTNSDGNNIIQKWNGTNWSTLSIMTQGGFGINQLYVANDIIYAASYNKTYSFGTYEVYKITPNTGYLQVEQYEILSGNEGINSITQDKFGNFYCVGNFTNSANNFYVAKLGNKTFSSTYKINKFSEYINLYPNPSHNQITIKSEFRIENEIMVYDIFGKQITKITPSQVYHQNIDVSSLKQGIYFIKINNQTLKFIKE